MSSVGSAEQAKEALTLANREAHRAQMTHIDTAHLLAGLLRAQRTPGQLLSRHGLTLDSARRQLGTEQQVDPEPGLELKLAPTQDLKACINAAVNAAREEGSVEIDGGHLLRGMLQDRQCPGTQLMISVELALDELSKELGAADTA